MLLATAGSSFAEAADPPAAEQKQESFLSKPLRWLKGRSAEKRFDQLDAAEPEAQAETEVAGTVQLDDSQDSFVPLIPEQPRTLETPPFQQAGGKLPDAATVLAPRVARVSMQSQATAPRELKRVTSILPYADYQPDTTQIEQQVSPDLIAPEEVDIAAPGEPRRIGEPILYQWRASNLYHYPLYFEDPSIERYGHTHESYIQPFTSIGRFGLQLVGLPYQMTIDPVWKRRYTLGHYRPGECAPKQYQQVPWNTKAAINQAAVTTGAFFLLP
ncbi:MAG: hypothetical protein ACYTGL_13020 [Planctomycetota bacterium]|jgi:hypothetical protein